MCATFRLYFLMRRRAFRIQKVLNPVSRWFIRDQVEGKVKPHLGRMTQGASYQNGRVKLELRGGSGTETVEADHVIASTGYKYDVRKLTFIDPQILGQLDLPKTVVAFRVNSPEFILWVQLNGPLLRFQVLGPAMAPRLSCHLTCTALTCTVRTMSQTLRSSVPVESVDTASK